jgi:hypothetical protein
MNNRPFKPFLGGIKEKEDASQHKTMRRLPTVF